ncbi:MAG: DUF2079 domain-containing protein [Kovacikia sp.]
MVQNTVQHRLNLLRAEPATWMTVGSALMLFVASSVRHILFQSNGWDLGIFDQAIYLISQGQPAISSLLGFHILGDHAVWIFYPLAILYKLYPSVFWLFAVQAIALAVGALPIRYLALQAGLTSAQAVAMMGVYLLYPLVFNLNLFDFHPEVIALPALLWAVLAARSQQLGWFCFAIVVVLGCKEVLALTVAAMGVWLLLWENRRVYGAIAIGSGILWFIVATQAIIPHFGGSVERHLAMYGSLGSTFPEVVSHLLKHPWLLLTQSVTAHNLIYLGLLGAPVLWGISFRYLAPLIAAIPQLVINLLTSTPAQKDLIHQYSLPILPFLLLSVMAALAARKTWLRSQRAIFLWSIVAFLALAKYGYFGSIYLDSLDTWHATRGAIAQIQSQGSVLTTHNIVPHLTHRSQIRFTLATAPPDLAQFDYVLLNLRHPGWMSTPEFAKSLVIQLQHNPKFQLLSQQDQVYSYRQID